MWRGDTPHSPPMSVQRNAVGGEGFAADLVIFDEKTIADRATFDQPHQFPTGITYVVVNGEVVFGDGMTGARPGIALRGAGYSLGAGAAGNVLTN